MIGMMEGLRKGASHQAGGGDHAVEPGVMNHLYDGFDPTTFLSKQGGEGLMVFNFTGGV